MDWDCDWTPLAVLLRLLRHLLYDGADDVHLRPCELAAVAEAHTRVHGDSEKGAPVLSLPVGHVDDAGEFLNRQLAAAVTVVGAKGESLPRVRLRSSLFHDVAVDFSEDAEAVVVCRSRMLFPHVVEVAFGMEAGEMSNLDDFREYLVHVFDEHPADLLFPLKRARGEVAAVGGCLVCRPSVGKLHLRTLGLAHLCELPLGHHGGLNVLKGACRVVLHVGCEEPLGELLGLRPVACSRRLRHALSVDKDANGPDASLLLLESAKSLCASASRFLAARGGLGGRGHWVVAAIG